MFKNINVTLQLDDLEKMKHTMARRKNIYLIFKEALNSAVKHTIRIVNTMGQAVFTQSFITASNKTTVEVAKWPSGIYWVELYDMRHERLITETFYIR